MRDWLALTALTGCAVAASATGCGGSSTTNGALGDDSGAEASADGASSGGQDATASSSGSSGSTSSSSGSSSGQGDATNGSSSGAGEGGDDSSGEASGSSSGGSDAGDGGTEASSSSSGGSSGGDAGTDATSDAAEAGSSCPDGTACSTGTGNGTCSGGVCVACSGGSTSAGIDATCTAAYGGASSPYVCVSGSCVPGNCNANADCNSMAGSPTCGFSTPNFCGGCTSDSQCPTGDICVVAAFDAGAVQGTCVAKNAGGCSGSGASACPANPADECCGGSCSNGDCCVGLTPNGCNGAVTTCAAEVTGQASGVCTTCTAVTGANPVYYVDPVHGSDANGTGNIATAAACAFQTITRALQVIGANAVSNTTIDVIGGTVDAGAPVVVQGTTGAPGAGQERFPIILGNNIAVTVSGGPVVVEVPSKGNGFVLSGTLATLLGGSGGATFTIDGQTHAANIGVVATSPSGVISGVKIQNFNAEGILVAAAAASITIRAGTTSDGNTGDGLLVQSGTVTATATGSFPAPISFDNNGAHGVRVMGSGVVALTGQLPSSTSAASVTMDGNGTAGIWMQNTTATTQSTFTGVTSSGSTGGNGMRIIPGSNVKVRGSSFLGNAGSGIDVENLTGGTSAAIGNIDLGKGTSGGDAGNNTLQSTATPNTAAGICLRLPGGGTGVTLSARGNIFGATNCQSTAGALTTATNRGCTAASDVGGTIAATGAANGNKIDVTMCTYP